MKHSICGHCTSGGNTPNAPLLASAIGLAAFGHHHPSPSGGLRAFAAAGATIVAPRQLEPYVRGLLSRPTTLGTPAIAAPDDAKLELFDGAVALRAADVAVRVSRVIEA